MSEAEPGNEPGRADIRPASDRDADGIAAVHVGSWLVTYAELPRTRRATEVGLAGRVALWTDRLRTPEPRSFALVATDGDRVRGFVYVGPTGDVDHDPNVVGQVRSIHVDPVSTGRGIGGRLMARAESSLRAAGYRAATLWVVEENRRARRFYERLGWRVDGARRREALAVDGEEGDDVEVVRYRLDLGPGPVGEP